MEIQTFSKFITIYRKNSANNNYESESSPEGSPSIPPGQPPSTPPVFAKEPGPNGEGPTCNCNADNNCPAGPPVKFFFNSDMEQIYLDLQKVIENSTKSTQIFLISSEITILLCLCFHKNYTQHHAQRLNDEGHLSNDS